jgi:hypothetical protein
LVARLAERLKEEDKLKRSLKVYTSFFEKEAPPGETNKQAFFRIVKAFPWSEITLFTVLAVSIMIYVKYRSTLYKLIERHAPWAIGRSTDFIGSAAILFFNFAVLLLSTYYGFKNLGKG